MRIQIMKNYIHPLIATLLFSVQVNAEPYLCEKIVNIGAWNIEWLGKPEKRKQNAQKVEDIAGYIKTSNVDVLALTEISNTNKNVGDQPLNTTLDEAFEQLNKSGAAWKYILFPKRDDTRDPQDQWTGIAWNEHKVHKVGGPWKLDAQISSEKENDIKGVVQEQIIWSRWPQASKFSAGTGLTDFIVVPIHLKSNTNGESIGVKARAYEVELLMSALDKLSNQITDKDIIILGDSNMLSSTETAGELFKQHHMKDCNSQDIATHFPKTNRFSPAPFDRIFLIDNQPETKNSCQENTLTSAPLKFEIVEPNKWMENISMKEFQTRLSDHLLVRTGICILKDDD